MMTPLISCRVTFLPCHGRLHSTERLSTQALGWRTRPARSQPVDLSSRCLALGSRRDHVHDLEIALLELLEKLRQTAGGDRLDVVHQHDALAGLFEALDRVLDHLLFCESVPVVRVDVDAP